MSSEKKFFHDRVILLLLSICVFLAALCTVLILLKIDAGRNEGYIIQYRSNINISPYKSGGLSEIISFIPFSAIVLVFGLIISRKIYPLQRNHAVTVLSMTVLLLMLSVIVSNALLSL